MAEESRMNDRNHPSIHPSIPPSLPPRESQLSLQPSSARRRRTSSSFVVRRSSSVVRRSSFVVRRSSFVVRRSSFVVRRSSFAAFVCFVVDFRRSSPSLLVFVVAVVGLFRRCSSSLDRSRGLLCLLSSNDERVRCLQRPTTNLYRSFLVRFGSVRFGLVSVTMSSKLFLLMLAVRRAGTNLGLGGGVYWRRRHKIISNKKI